jgi:hypothetical protein
MKYNGYGNSVNEKPEGEWIEIFASDWFKDYWVFYAFISLGSYEKDIAEVNDLIHEMNWRDGDIYVELINHSDGLKDFYHWLYDQGYFTHHVVLDIEKWRQWLKENEDHQGLVKLRKLAETLDPKNLFRKPEDRK